MKVDVKFDFLGSRHYIHSTQLTYKLLEILKEHGYYNSYSDVSKITSIYKSVADKQGFFIIDESYDGTHAAVFNIYINDKEYKAWYVEGDEPVNSRIDYDESSLITGFELDKANMQSLVKLKHDDLLYNTIIALGRQIVSAAIDTEGYTPWLIGKYNFKWGELHNNPVGKTLIFKVVNNIDNVYIQSKIYLDDVFIGTLDNARKKIEE